MIVCFNCNRQTKELLDSLLQTGQYGGYAEVIEAGLHNLNVLHHRISEDGILVLDETQAKASRGFGTQQGSITQQVQVPFLSAQGVPRLFRVSELASEPPVPLP